MLHTTMITFFSLGIQHVCLFFKKIHKANLGLLIDDIGDILQHWLIARVWGSERVDVFTVEILILMVILSWLVLHCGFDRFLYYIKDYEGPTTSDTEDQWLEHEMYKSAGRKQPGERTGAEPGKRWVNSSLHPSTIFMNGNTPSSILIGAVVRNDLGACAHAVDYAMPLSCSLWRPATITKCGAGDGKALFFISLWRIIASQSKPYWARW